MKDYCTSSVLIIELQLNYKSSFNMEAAEKLEVKKMFKNFTYDVKKRFAFCTCRRLQNQKNTLSPQKNTSATICKTAQKLVVTKILQHAVKLMLEKYF